MRPKCLTQLQPLSPHNSFLPMSTVNQNKVGGRFFNLVIGDFSRIGDHPPDSRVSSSAFLRPSRYRSMRRMMAVKTVFVLFIHSFFSFCLIC